MAIDLSEDFLSGNATNAASSKVGGAGSKLLIPRFLNPCLRRLEAGDQQSGEAGAVRRGELQELFGECLGVAINHGILGNQ